MTPKVSIIILQYNNSQSTIACLDLLRGIDYTDCDVLVVDNASTEEHYHNIRFYLERNAGSLELPIRLIATPQNTGYAGGNNVGIQEALKNNPDYILILNPVSEFEKDFLTKLVRRIETDRNISIIGPVNDEGDRKVYGGLIRWLQPRLYHSEYPLLADYFPEDRYLSGNALLIRTDVFSKIGLFDERYFLYFEDVDFCVRAHRAGLKLAIANDTVVKHLVSTATKKLGSPILLRYHYRNAHLFNWKFGPWWATVMLPLWSIWVIVKQIGKIIFSADKRVVSQAILAGVLDFYLRKFGHIAS